ncbi:hypothetical protein Tco_0715752, partial [Tanacetum coccineum]
MESSNSNSKERELQLTQRLVKQRHSYCMAWFEQLETHLHDLYLNSSSYAIDAFKPAFHSFFGEEHQTFRLKMFHNLDQLRLQLERENLLEVNPRTCLEALRTQFKDFLPPKGMDVKALHADLVVMESKGIESGKHDTSSSSGTYITHAVDADIRTLVKEASSEAKISSGHRFSPKKTSAVYEKTSPRSCHRWKPMGIIFITVGLKWIPIGKLFDSCTSKVDSEPLNGSNDDITNPYKCNQTLNVSVGPEPQLMTPGTINSRLVQNIPSPTLVVPPTKNDRDSLFQSMFDEYFKPPPNVDHPVPEVPTPVLAASTSSPSSTTVDQDAPSTSTSQNTSEQQSSVIPQGVEDDFYDIEVAHMDN